MVPQDLEDNDLDDVKAFKVLINHQDMLESKFVTLNANMTKLIKVVKINLMRPVPPAFVGQGPSSGLVPPRAPTLLAGQWSLPMGKEPSKPLTSKEGDEFRRFTLRMCRFWNIKEWKKIKI